MDIKWTLFLSFKMRFVNYPVNSMDLNRYRTSWSTRSGQDPGQASAPNRRTLIRWRDQIDLIKFYQNYSNRKIPIICNLRFRQTRNCGSILNTLVHRSSVPDQEQISEALEKIQTVVLLQMLASMWFVFSWWWHTEMLATVLTSRDLATTFLVRNIRHQNLCNIDYVTWTLSHVAWNIP